MAFSVTVKVEMRAPVAAGVKVTLMVQVALAAKGEGLRGQLLVCPKSPGLVPVKSMLVIVNAVPLGLESVTAWAAPVVPTFWFPKSGTGDGERTGSDTPVPDTPADSGIAPSWAGAGNVGLREPVAVRGEVTLSVQARLGTEVGRLKGELMRRPK